jgi:hypothetical protein
VMVTTGELGNLRPIGSQAPEPIEGVAVLANGAIASVDAGGHLAAAYPTGEIRKIDLGVRAQSMTADDARLFVGAANGSIGFLDPSGPGVPTWTPAHASEVTAIALRPDGAALATGSDDRSIIVWNVGSDGRLTLVERLIGQGEKVTSLTWSGDGRWLASAGEDSHVILWDVASGLEIGDPIAVSGEPAVSFRRTGDRQLFVSVDGLARWDMRPDAWAGIACTITAGRPFSSIEQDRFNVTSSTDTGCPQ